MDEILFLVFIHVTLVLQSEDIITPKCTESLVSAIPANYQPGTNAPSQEELNDDTGPSSQVSLCNCLVKYNV